MAIKHRTLGLQVKNDTDYAIDTTNYPTKYKKNISHTWDILQVHCERDTGCLLMIIQSKLPISLKHLEMVTVRGTKLGMKKSIPYLLSVTFEAIHYLIHLS